jgi:hypothetical protein
MGEGLMEQPITRLADRDLITGQPLFCPECGLPLSNKGKCQDGREKCGLYWRGEYEEYKPFPDYDRRND